VESKDGFAAGFVLWGFVWMAEDVLDHTDGDSGSPALGSCPRARHV